MIWQISRLEIQRLLRTPLAWFSAAIICALVSFIFLSFVDDFSGRIQPAIAASKASGGVSQHVVGPTILWSAFINIALLPIFGGRLIAGEREQHTWALLASAPLRPIELVLGKYTGQLIWNSVMTLPAAAMTALLAAGSVFDWGTWISGVTAHWLILAAVAAAVLYFSSRANEAANATVTSYGLLLVFIILYVASGNASDQSAPLYAIGPIPHLLPALQGKFHSTDLIYFSCFTLVFLWMTLRRFGSSAIRGQQALTDAPQGKRAIKHKAVTIAGLIVVTSAALLLARTPITADLSSLNRNSLPAAVTQTLQSLERSIEIEAWIEDRKILRDRVTDAFEPYQRIKPNIRLNWNPLTVSDQGALAQQGTLILKYENQQVTLQSLQAIEIQSALLQLQRGKQRYIGVLDASLTTPSPTDTTQNYSQLTEALKRLSYRTWPIDTNAPLLPDNIDTLLFVNRGATASAAAAAALKNWIAAGKPVLWLQDGQPDPELDAIMGSLGLSTLPGVIIDAEDSLRRQYRLNHPAIVPAISSNASPILPDGAALFPRATGFANLDILPWQATPILQSTDASWNEISPLSGKVFKDSGDEQAGPLNLAFSLQRPLGTGVQRIVVVGDTDFASNAYLGMAQNSRFAERALIWLSGDDLLLGSDAPASDNKLLLTPSYLNAIALAFMVVLPAGLMIRGGALWYRRIHARIT